MQDSILTNDLLHISLSPTPWNDRVLGGKTCHMNIVGASDYALSHDISKRDHWLACRLADDGYVYVSTTIEASDTLGKCLVQHLAFEFVYQTNTCLLRLAPDIPLRDTHPGFHVVDPVSVTADEVVQVCAPTLKHGRFCEDYLTRNLAELRNALFVRDLHDNPSVHRIFTRSPDGRLNGYAYLPIEDGSVDLLLMGILEAASPPSSGQVFWEICLSALRAKDLARRVKTRVPAANLGVMNIYAALGFSFVRPAYDFRMFPANTLAAS